MREGNGDVPLEGETLVCGREGCDGGDGMCEGWCWCGGGGGGMRCLTEDLQGPGEVEGVEVRMYGVQDSKRSRGGHIEVPWLVAIRLWLRA